VPDGDIEDFVKMFERADGRAAAEHIEKEQPNEKKEEAPVAPAETTEAPKPPKPRIDPSVKATLDKFDGKKVGAALAQLRDDLRIGEDEVASTLGITKARLGNIEKDASSATLDELHRLATGYAYTLGGMLKRVTK